MDKFICSIRIGRHFSHQATNGYSFIGLNTEFVNLQRIRYLIMLEDIKDEQIQSFKEILPDKKRDKSFNVLLQVENLKNKMMSEEIFKSKDFRLLYRLKQKIFNTNEFGKNLENYKNIYFRSIANRQGTQILIALKQYKNKTGSWPEKLDEIKSFLTSEDILIDPQNKGTFVYKLSGDSFVLYSIGPDNIDNYQKSSDDSFYWEPSYH